MRRFLQISAATSAGQTLFARDFSHSYEVGRDGQDGGRQGRGSNRRNQHGSRDKGGGGCGCGDGHGGRKGSYNDGTTTSYVRNKTQQFDTPPQRKHQQLQRGSGTNIRSARRTLYLHLLRRPASSQVQPRGNTFIAEESRDHDKVLNCKLLDLTIECKIETKACSGLNTYEYLA